MAEPTRWNDEHIIADALGRAPDVTLGADHGRWRLCRWRQFVGSYTLPPLPDPMFVVHIAGKPNVRTWERDGWSETASLPGCATIVPSNQPTGWLVDGELDVVTLSVSSSDLQRAPALDQFKRMRFAFSDPLGVALTRQVLGELYAPQTPERDVYVGALVDALKAHMLRGPVSAPSAEIPTSAFSSYRIHHIMNAIQKRPEAEHSLEEMAAQAGVTPTHFCRIFKRATGVSPHQYVMRARLDRAQQMLEQSDASMATIAEALGFTSQSHFTRAFRQFAGQTPSDYRRRGRETLQ
ncbi:helix-turn-helix domain-containing protein [Flavisphingomonas formosensis]|uniref:helix-turn-helix domain-containing protein n=1 Tax=Flavisphingomonas formosensis TaxID=861534 RepID=UPI0012FBA845|nr:AraC family transcriptional regulator [Sphingomonas formosensis]